MVDAQIRIEESVLIWLVILGGPLVVAVQEKCDDDNRWQIVNDPFIVDCYALKGSITRISRQI